MDLEKAAEGATNTSPQNQPTEVNALEGTVPDGASETQPANHEVEDGRPSSPEIESMGLNVLRRGMREMVDLVNRLRASGVEDLGLPLPRIAVVGNQSAGKSSLIEAISGIKVPRYTGTCTRCPLEINLSESLNPGDPWRCRISLRFKKQYDPANANQGGVRTRGNPWVDQATEQVHFLDITDKRQVESVLVRAQRAVLNPGKNWRDFVYESADPGVDNGRQKQHGGSWGGFKNSKGRKEEENFEVKFSPNVVCMEITGANLPNLAFIDLPGVIQTTESEREHYLIELVTGLVKEYVQEEDCLILLAMTMKDDAVNQSAARLAREMGEERTIGALTKPDTVEAGEHGQWINILRGNSHRLRKHGYFVTKQPSQDQLVSAIDHAEARAQETEFFNTTEPWKTELADLRDRFGTERLQSYLANELGELIKKRLPEIIDTIRSQAAQVEEELATLPAPPTDNQTLLVHNLLNKFDSFVGDHLLGINDKNYFQRDLQKLAEDFRKVLKAFRPTLIVHETFEEERKAAKIYNSPPRNWENSRTGWLLNGGISPGQCVPVTLSSDEDQVVKTPTPVRKRPAGAPDSTLTTPTKKAKKATPVRPSHKFTLAQIRDIIEATATARIPGQIDPKATNSMIKQSVNLWRPAVFSFLDSCGMLLNKYIHNCFTETFMAYQKSPVFETAFQIINDFLLGLFEQQKNALTRLWRLEVDQILTLNTDYNASEKGHLEMLLGLRRRNIESQRENARAEKAELDSRAGGGGRGVAKGRRGPSPPNDEDMPDPYHKEIAVLAQVRAYNEIAQKRFLDNVYMSIQGEWLTGCRAGLLHELQNELGLNEPDANERCRKMLLEDPEKERRRAELLAKKEQLQKALNELSRL